jgi:Rha family phage regulatory protein
MPEKSLHQTQRAERRALIAQDLLADPEIGVRAIAKRHGVSQTTVRNVMREIGATDDVGGEPRAEAVVFARNGKIFANSLNVASRFRKRHDNVKRDIYELCCSENFRFLNFEEVHEINNLGQTVTSVNMTKDGFAFLVFGYGGSDAGTLKEEYIARFNEMEAKLRKPVVAAVPDFNDPIVLRGFLLNVTEQNIVLKEKVEEQKIEIEFKDSVIERLTPEAEAIRRIAKAEGCYCITDAGKALDMGQKAMFEWLKANGWIYRRPFNATWIPYQDKINAGYMLSKVWVQPMPDGTEKVRMQPLVTANGLTRIATLMFKMPPKGGGAASQTDLPV